MISPCQQPIVKVEYGEKSSQEQQDTYLALTITSLSTAHFLINLANRLLFFRTKQVCEIAMYRQRRTVYDSKQKTYLRFSLKMGEIGAEKTQK